MASQVEARVVGRRSETINVAAGVQPSTVRSMATRRHSVAGPPPNLAAIAAAGSSPIPTARSSSSPTTTTTTTASQKVRRHSLAAHPPVSLSATAAAAGGSSFAGRPLLPLPERLTAVGAGAGANGSRVASPRARRPSVGVNCHPTIRQEQATTTTKEGSTDGGVPSDPLTADVYIADCIRAVEFQPIAGDPLPKPSGVFEEVLQTMTVTTSDDDVRRPAAAMKDADADKDEGGDEKENSASNGNKSSAGPRGNNVVKTSAAHSKKGK